MGFLYLISKFIKKIHIPAIHNSNLSKSSKVCSGSHIVNSKLGSYSYIGNDCTVIKTEIGKFCSIADNNIIGGASHPINWVSTSPVFYEGRNILRKNFSNHEFNSFKKTVIENDVWIGNNCLIKSGVTISNGAIIGMGSVVTKDIGPYEVWAGNPAKLIRKRFDDNTVEKLIQDEWWNKSISEIKLSAREFNNIRSYIS